MLLLRNPHKFNLKNERIHIVKGDVLEISDVEKAIAGCDVVIHAAADTVQHHRSIDDYKVNTLGTKNILSACKKKNIQKVIHVGSAGYFGYGTLENPREEINPIRYPSNKSFYLLSKLHAQKLVQDYSRSGHIVTISPTFMIGSLDFGPSSGKIILMGLKKSHFFVRPEGKTLCTLKMWQQLVSMPLTTENQVKITLLEMKTYLTTTSFNWLKRVQKRRALLFPFHLLFFI